MENAKYKKHENCNSLEVCFGNLLEKSEGKVQTSPVLLGSVRGLSLIDTLKVLAAGGGSGGGVDLRECWQSLWGCWCSCADCVSHLFPLCLISPQTSLILHAEISHRTAPPLPLCQCKLPPLLLVVSQDFWLHTCKFRDVALSGFPLKADAGLVKNLPVIYLHQSEEIIHSSQPGSHVYLHVLACMHYVILNKEWRETILLKDKVSLPTDWAHKHLCRCILCCGVRMIRNSWSRPLPSSESAEASTPGPLWLQGASVWEGRDSVGQLAPEECSRGQCLGPCQRLHWAF